MFKLSRRLFKKVRASFNAALILIKRGSPKYQYRLISIEQDSDDTFIAEVQLINKNHIFRMRPEEILANDYLTDSFSQRDIRTLTYLGYLGINSPKYKVLAKRLSENDANIIFAIQERGKKKPIIKTASEISSDQELITGFDQIDAHMIGYAIATVQAGEEYKQKKELLSQETK